MPSCRPKRASQNRDITLIASATERPKIRRSSTTHVGVIVGQTKKILAPFFVLLMLALFAPGGNQAWSQDLPSSPAQPELDRPAASAATPDTGETVAPPQKNPTVPAIGVGDLLKVSVLGAPESDQEVRVGADGNIFLNFIGAVPVVGQTTEEAQAMIAKKLAAGSFFTNPQVSVFAKEYATQGVSVLGEVQKPGVYPMLGARRLFDILSLAGGTTARAGKLVSITHRDAPQTPSTVTLSNDATESVQSNVDVFPGDTVVVSRAGVVYVSGEVRKPSGVIMENGSEMTVLQAIAMAEGALPNAALNKSKLIRRTPSGPHEIPLRLGDMFASKVPDLRLQADDIIFVPNSAAKSAGKRSLDAIISTATGLIIYGVRP
jgi:polysaccharide biosynthesis/export protein